MADERKPWCEVDVKACTCECGECLGGRHKAIIDQFNELTRYGLTTEEILGDMEYKSPEAS